MASLGSLPIAVPQASTDRSTTQKFPLGQRAYDALGNEYAYVKAGAAISQYEAVKFNGSTLGWDDVRKTAAANEVVIGVADAAFASGEYGFIGVRGVFTVKVVAATAAGSALVSSSTAGTLALAVATDLAGQKGAVALATGSTSGSAVAFV